MFGNNKYFSYFGTLANLKNKHNRLVIHNHDSHLGKHLSGAYASREQKMRNNEINKTCAIPEIFVFLVQLKKKN